MFNRLFGPFYDWHSNQPPFVQLLVVWFHIFPVIYGILWAIVHIPFYMVATFIGYWWCDDCKKVFHIWKDGKAQKPFHSSGFYCPVCYDKHSIHISILLPDYTSTLFEPKKEDIPDTL